MTLNDALLKKVATIEHCLKRIHEDYEGHQDNLANDLMRQDAIILNLERICEAAIDAGMNLVRVKRLGLPQSTREVFTLLARASIIDDQLCTLMQHMVGFRNIAVHDYQTL